MKLLLTGANGFLGFYLSNILLNNGHQLLATGRGDCRLPFINRPGFSYAPMEVTDPAQIKTVVSFFKPDYIIHAAAIGKPDDCELNKELASQINTEGTFHLLAAAKEVGSHFCYISTDFVFDGVAGNYTENAHRQPVNHYGQTKLDAELLVEQFAGNWSIVRTVLVYGKPMTGRENLLSIVKSKLRNGEPYHVVDDQIRTPTYVGDLAEGILRIVTQNVSGVFHLCGEEVLTPYAMAFRAANYLQLDTNLLIKTSSAHFVQPAKRPMVTGLSIERAKSVLGFTPVSFERGLELTFD